MKRFLLLISIFITCLSSYAQNLTDGFYRVYNKGEKRYIYVIDNTGTATASKQDLGAVQLVVGLEKTISDPASVLYVEKRSGNEYDIKAQGTSVAQIIGKCPQIVWTSKLNAYRVGANVSGAQLWLGSDNDPEDVRGAVTVKDLGGSDKIGWIVEPIKSDGNNYFGLTPSIQIGDKYYQSFYADFAFSFYSEGMKAYFVDATEAGEARLIPVEQDVIPAATPLIIECSSKNASDNRLELKYKQGTPLKSNILKGNYFYNKYRKHARIPYDKNTMRVLGKTSDGKLGFVTTNDEYLAANSAYLVVAAGSEETVLAVDEKSYSSIELPDSDIIEVGGVYSILGVKLRQDANIEDLPSGVYIVNGKKVIKR